ncbi:hypothetical protein SAMN02745116_00170 [Pilibacter termitis]|uniref:Uncharacterized protein n=1 Tax=Pilibacter termitis TaxID=263852 RepID=A0A1T4KBC6_9ENTE|nr:hypothetical protein [Pilibacter termitis]SJZ39740.1 hypothetical protein SAMN02745116_00170 [Pilibacter termitis]
MITTWKIEMLVVRHSGSEAYTFTVETEGIGDNEEMKEAIIQANQNLKILLACKGEEYMRIGMMSVEKIGSEVEIQSKSA